MEEQKYFTPEITDIRVGYEYEEAEMDYSCNGCPPRGWNKTVFGEDINLDLRTGSLPHLPHPVYMRVPYLTKEQIEAEGWREKTEDNFVKENHNIDLYFKTYKQKMWLMVPLFTTGVENLRANLYCGYCKDINTFRYITKLLNI